MPVENLSKIRDRVRKEGLIERLSAEEMSKFQGYGFVLRVGALYEMQQPETKFCEGELLTRRACLDEVARYSNDGERQECRWLTANGYYVVETAERLNTVPDLMPVVYSLAHLSRAGLQIFPAAVPLGHRGALTFGLQNMNNFRVALEMGIDICQVVFHKVEGER